MNRFIIAAACAFATLGTGLVATPALADPPSWAPAHGRRAHDGEYDRYGRYTQPHAISSRDRVWRGRDGRYHCRRNNGTTGLVIGAVGGALVGRTIDTRGDHTPVDAAAFFGVPLGVLGAEIHFGQRLGALHRGQRQGIARAGRVCERGMGIEEAQHLVLRGRLGL